MKTLELNFTKKGFAFRQLGREGSVAIYERSKGEAEPHFEVVRIGSHNGYVLAGVSIPPAETYPSSEMWGTRGWTFNDRERAWAKFRQLLTP